MRYTNDGKKYFRVCHSDTFRHSRCVPLHSQSLLKTLIKEEFPSLSAFAKQCGISQSLVWRDCQDRQISDKRFVAYLKVLSVEGRKRLARARLRDIFSGEFESLVEVRTSTKAKGKSSNLALLSPDTQAGIDKLAGEMAQDSELHDWVMQFVRKIC